MIVLYLYHGKIHRRDHFLSVLEPENTKTTENQALIEEHLPKMSLLKREAYLNKI